MYIPVYFLIFSFNMMFYKTKILLVIYLSATHMLKAKYASSK